MQNPETIVVTDPVMAMLIQIANDPNVDLYESTHYLRSPEDNQEEPDTLMEICYLQRTGRWSVGSVDFALRPDGPDEEFDDLYAAVAAAMARGFTEYHHLHRDEGDEVVK